jgi:hypothetical protein
MGEEAANSVATDNIDLSPLVWGVGMGRNKKRDLCTTCPTPAHRLIHNILWSGWGADTNSSADSRRVNKPSVARRENLWGQEILKKNQGCLWGERPNLDQ